MPFTKINVNDVIEREKDNDPEFARIWDESCAEYKLLGEMIRLRKEKNLTQTELAEMAGYKQQVISRIEKRDNSPTLKTFCNLLNALGYDLQIVKKCNKV